jgi:hypothetical protein
MTDPLLMGQAQPESERLSGRLRQFLIVVLAQRRAQTNEGRSVSRASQSGRPRSLGRGLVSKHHRMADAAQLNTKE